MCLICVYVPYLWVGRKDYELVPALCCPCASPFLCLAVPVLLIGSFSFLGTSLAQAQAAPSNVASSAHPDASPQPDVAGPGAYSISFDSGPISINGTYHVLIGQECQAKINLPPVVANATVSCQWTISGNTVQANSWNVASGDTSATFSGLVNPFTSSSQAVAPATTADAIWYWDDSTTSQTVTCNVTITPPTGAGAPTSKTVTQQVTLDIPTYTPGASVGTVQLDSSYAGTPGVPALHAGAGANNVPGITFNDKVAVPAFYASLGAWCHTQLISVNQYETPNGSTTPIGSLGNSVKGALDAGPEDPGGVSYIYMGSFPADGTLPASPDNDSPGFAVHDTYQEYNVKTESFQDFVMYTPPIQSNSSGQQIGNSIFVPLESFTWSWNVDVTTLPPNPSTWELWSSNNTPTKGTITPPASATRQLTYPTWSSLRNLAWGS